MQKPISALHVRAEGAVYSVLVGSLEDMQKAVGGWIEPITLPTGCVLYVNEDGSLMRLPRNLIAERLAGRGPLVGDALVVGPTNRDGDDTDVPEAESLRALTAQAWVAALRERGI